MGEKREKEDSDLREQIPLHGVLRGFPL